MKINLLKKIFIASCLFLSLNTNAVSSEYLEGVWILNMALTIQQSSNALPQQTLNGLKSNADMAYVFKNNKTSYTPYESIKEQDVWFDWDLISESDETITVIVDSDKQIAFLKYKDCIGLTISQYSYVEYYCKVKK